MKNDQIVDKKIIWKEFTSKNGVPYSVGYLEDEIEHIDKMILDASSTSKPQNVGKIDVNWPVLNDSWKIPKEAVRKEAHISKYMLHLNGDGKGIYRYELNVNNTKRNVTYHFMDKSGDVYELWCFWERAHYLKYNSTDPTIILVIHNK